MKLDDPHLSLRLAASEQDLRAAQRLRYTVFVEELGGDGPLVDHENRLEKDRFDPHYDHLVLVDGRRDAEALDHVVGVYRLMRSDRMGTLKEFYTEGEYDISVLKASGRKLLELGRSCVHRDFRGSHAMFHLWAGLAEYVAQHDIEILFGVASFHGTDLHALAQPLSYLHHAHLAPADLRVTARTDQARSMALCPEAQINRPQALRETPALIKGYLRLGGFVGEGAYLDEAFNTTDVCLVMDTERLSAQAQSRYGKVLQ